MDLKYFVVQAFSKADRGGNPAGVVLDAGGLSARLMKKIASKLGYPETAFVQPSSAADFRVRFFAPKAEVDLCGHATIATFSLLAALKSIVPGNYEQETKAGILAVEVCDDGSVFMEQNLPQFFSKIDPERMARALNASPTAFLPELPIQVVSTALKDIMVPVRSLAQLHRMDPDPEDTAAVCRQFDAVGVHLFSFETEGEAAAHCRNFAPHLGIVEEAATGTSTGALSCYLQKYCGMGSEDLIFEQGYALNSPSEIRVKLSVSDGRVSRVRVGGTAGNIRAKTLYI